MTASDITFYATGAGFGMPETSPFVIKTEVQLKMAGLAYRKEFTIPPNAPRSKVPYIEDEGHVVTDSTHVRTYVEHKYHLDLDDGLDARQRAESWAIERMMEDHLYWAMVWFRWVDADNFAKGPAHFADRAPEAARAQIREEMQARKIGELHSHGLGRHTPEQIAELGKRSLDALAVLLGDKPYLFGEKPHAADAIAFGVVASVLTPFFETPLRRAAESHSNLVAYAARMMHRYYPEHAWEVPPQSVAA
jgi:glutathione S-transferase